MSYMDPFLNAAQEVRDRGWAFLDCPEQCEPARVLDLAPAFFDRRSGDWERWRAQRPGEDEPDVGVLMSTPSDQNHAGVAKDDKVHLMYTDDMARLVKEQHGTNIWSDPADQEFVELVQTLHMAGHDIAINMLDAITQVCELDVNLADAYKFAQTGCKPWSTTATRVMQYFRKGGQPHEDRCGITSPHWGDRNGTLFVEDRKGDRHEVTPPKGKVLVFASIKLAIATKGIIPAVPHGSICEASDRRLALVTFANLATTPDINDFRLAKERGLMKHEICAA